MVPLDGGRREVHAPSPALNPSPGAARRLPSGDTYRRGSLGGRGGGGVNAQRDGPVGVGNCSRRGGDLYSVALARGRAEGVVGALRRESARRRDHNLCTVGPSFVVCNRLPRCHAPRSTANFSLSPPGHRVKGKPTPRSIAPRSRCQSCQAHL